MGDTFAALQDINAAINIEPTAELLTNRGVIHQASFSLHTVFFFLQPLTLVLLDHLDWKVTSTLKGCRDTYDRWVKAKKTSV